MPDVVEAARAAARVDEPHLQVILKVLANTGKVVAHGDAGGLQR